MTDKLILPDGSVAVWRGQLIDQFGRAWEYQCCFARGLRDITHTEVVVRRITNGKPAKVDSAFKVGFFPGCRIKPEYPENIPPYNLNGEFMVEGV